MAYIVQPDVVHYVCTCGLLKPISKLYFCRYCLQMRCGFCVCHEIDSLSCGKCAENIPSSEVRLKKNKCSNCYDCPCCQHQLTTRIAYSGQRASSDPKSTPKKVYYLTCLFCRWNTRDVGIPDQAVVSEGWPKRENIYINRILNIQEKYKAFLLWEKQQKLDIEKKKHIQRGKFPTLTDKTGLYAAAIRKKIGLPDLNKSILKPIENDGTSAEAVDEIEILKQEIFTEPLNLYEVTTLEQRLLQPDWQSPSVNLLFPLQKHLSVKQSLRCRTCEHNVSKPEYNPNSVRFKIQLFAYYHVPEVRVVTCEPLQIGETSELTLKLSNPTPYQTTVKFLPFDHVEQREKNKTNIVEDESTLKSGSTLANQSSMTVEARPIDVKITGEIALPEASIILHRRDDLAEYDETEDTDFEDDPKLVIWRKLNKVIIKLKVTPSADLKVGDKVVIGFTMQHIYINIITSKDNKERQKHEHRFKVLLTLDKVVGSE